MNILFSLLALILIYDSISQDDFSNDPYFDCYFDVANKMGPDADEARISDCADTCYLDKFEAINKNGKLNKEKVWKMINIMVIEDNDQSMVDEFSETFDALIYNCSSLKVLPDKCANGAQYFDCLGTY
uniref:Uncharacterized protein n=1 Tax=Megaselia scalaris TaxID=36166 RepID=T1GVU7_MEGSC